MKKLVKAVMAILLAALTMISIVACKAVETPSFIKEYLCVEHQYGAGVVERAATCIREGRIKYVCQECGAEKTETLAKVAHTPYTVPAREATCAQTGYAEHQACAVCAVVLSERNTTPKIPCTHENDVYLALGTFTCTLCGDERMEYQEHTVQASSFVLGAVYRFYIPQAGSKALITFTRTDAEPEASWGKIKTKEGASVIVSSFSIGFKRIDGEKLGPIWYGGSSLYYVDVLMREGIDYVDIYIGAETMTGAYAGNEYAEIELTLQKDKLDLSERGFAITTTNGAKIVRLDGVTEGDLLG